MVWCGVIVACFSVLYRISPEGLSIVIKLLTIANTVTTGTLTRHFQNVCQRYYLYRQIGGATEENSRRSRHACDKWRELQYL